MPALIHWSNKGSDSFVVVQLEHCPDLEASESLCDVISGAIDFTDRGCPGTSISVDHAPGD